MNQPAPGWPHRFPKVASGSRLATLLGLAAAGLARAAAGGGIGLCIGKALGGGPPVTGMMLGTIAVLVPLGFALRLLEARLGEQLGQSFLFQVRLRMVHAVHELSRTSQRQGTDQLGRLVTDLNSLKNWVSLGFAQVLCGAMALLVLLLLLALSSRATFWIALGFVLCVASTVAVLTPFLRDRLRALRKHRGRITRSVVSSVLTNSTRSIQEIERLQGRLKPLAVRNAVSTAALRRIPELMHGLVLILVALQFRSHREADPLPLPAPAALLLLGLVGTSLSECVRAWSYRLDYLEGRRRIARLFRHAREGARDAGAQGLTSAGRTEGTSAPPLLPSLAAPQTGGVLGADSAADA